MDEFDRLVEEGKRSAQKAGKAVAEPAPTELGESAARNEQSLWEETLSRGRRAGERLGEEWERISGSARDYARDHSVGVAIGSLGLGLILGLALGLLARRD